jgi:hypothetical protein
LLAESEVVAHGFEGLLGFVGVGLQEEEEALVAVELLVVDDLVLCHVLVELSNLLALVLVVFDLSVVEEPRALLRELRLLLLVWVGAVVPLGKNR